MKFNATGQYGSADHKGKSNEPSQLFHKHTKSSVHPGSIRSTVVTPRESPAPSLDPQKKVSMLDPLLNKVSTVMGNVGGKRVAESIVHHKKSLSTAQYPGSPKASEMLAHITAKYTGTIKKTHVPTTTAAVKQSATILHNSSNRRLDVRHEDPTGSLESLINRPSKSPQCTKKNERRPGDKMALRPVSKGKPSVNSFPNTNMTPNPNPNLNPNPNPKPLPKSQLPGHQRVNSEVPFVQKTVSPSASQGLRSPHGNPPIEVTHKSHVKLVCNPDDHAGEPQFFNPRLKPEPPSLPYASNTTITNNTNIILMASKPYNANTSTHSPRDVFQIHPKPDITADKVAVTGMLPHRLVIKRLLNKSNVPERDERSQPVSPTTSIGKKGLGCGTTASSINSCVRPPSEASLISHKHSVSDAHKLPSYKATQTIATAQKVREDKQHLQAQSPPYMQIQTQTQVSTNPNFSAGQGNLDKLAATQQPKANLYPNPNPNPKSKSKSKAQTKAKQIQSARRSGVGIEDGIELFLKPVPNEMLRPPLKATAPASGSGSRVSGKEERGSARGAGSSQIQIQSQTQSQSQNMKGIEPKAKKGKPVIVARVLQAVCKRKTTKSEANSTNNSLDLKLRSQPPSTVLSRTEARVRNRFRRYKQGGDWGVP